MFTPVVVIVPKEAYEMLSVYILIVLRKGNLREASRASHNATYHSSVRVCGGSILSRLASSYSIFNLLLGAHYVQVHCVPFTQ